MSRDIYVFCLALFRSNPRYWSLNDHSSSYDDGWSSSPRILIRREALGPRVGRLRFADYLSPSKVLLGRKRRTSVSLEPDALSSQMINALSLWQPGVNRPGLPPRSATAELASLVLCGIVRTRIASEVLSSLLRRIESVADRRRVVATRRCCAFRALTR
jgi:hypothetical protein